MAWSKSPGRDLVRGATSAAGEVERALLALVRRSARGTVRRRPRSRACVACGTSRRRSSRRRSSSCTAPATAAGRAARPRQRSDSGRGRGRTEDRRAHPRAAPLPDRGWRTRARGTTRREVGTAAGGPPCRTRRRRRTPPGGTARRPTVRRCGTSRRGTGSGSATRCRLGAAHLHPLVRHMLNTTWISS